MTSIRKQQQENGWSLSVDPNLLNSYSIEGPVNGPTISADRSKAPSFKNACRSELSRIDGWLREEHRLFKKNGMMVEWDDNIYQFCLVRGARKSLEEWFNVLDALIGTEDDAASVESFLDADSPDDEDGTQWSSRRSSLSSDVTGVSKEGSTAPSTINPPPTCEAWELV